MKGKIEDKYIDLSSLFKETFPHYLENYTKNNKLNLSDIDKTDVIGNSLLHHATENGDEELVNLLLENGAAVNLTINNGQNAKKKPLDLVISKIKDNQEKNKTEAINKFQNIQSLLLDYGANHSPIKKFKLKEKKKQQYKEEFLEEIKDKLKTTTEIVRDKKKADNHQIVIDCAEENKDLEQIYLSFYNLLQGKLNSAILGIKSAASNKLQLKHGLDVKLVHILSNPISNLVPGVGDIFEVTISEGYKCLANKKQLENLQHQMSFFISNEHTDEVIQDFSARITSYYKEDIVNPDVDLGHKIGQKSPQKLTQLKLKLTSLISGLSTKELLEKYQKKGEKIVLPHWEQIINKSIVKFFDYLKNTEIGYSADFGIKIVESFLPNFLQSPMVFDEKMNEFSINNARKLGLVVELAYMSKKKIEEISKTWGFKECYVRQSNLFKSLIMHNEEKMIIGFRGTYHSKNWWNNFNVLKTKMNIKDKVIKVHTGFYEALMMHWEKGDEIEKPLKEIVQEYLLLNPAAKIYIAGHSLGGAMAGIGYCQLLELKINNKIILQPDQMCLYTYGQPLWVYKGSSKAAVKELFNGNYHKIINYQDAVPMLPQEILGYRELGEIYYLHKDGTMLDEKAFAKIKKEADEKGYKHITNNLIAKALYTEQHAISSYNKQLSKCGNNIISIKVDSLSITKEEKIPHTSSLRDPFDKKLLNKLESLLINSTLEKSEQKAIVKLTQSNKIVFPNKSTSKKNDNKETSNKSAQTTSVPLKIDSHNLIEVVRNGDVETFKSLIQEKKVDLASWDEYGKTLLHIAAEGGNEKIVEMILKTEPKLINKRTYSSVEKQRQEGLNKLIQERPDLNTPPKKKKIALEKKEDLIKEEEENDGKTVLHSAAEGGNLNIVKTILNQNPELIDIVADKKTVLHSAAQGGNNEIVELLLQMKPELINMGIKKGHVSRKKEKTLLYYAIKGGNEEVIESLLKVKPDLIDAANTGILHYAIGKGNEKIIEILLKVKPDESYDNVDKFKLDFQTIQIAAENGNAKLVELLLKKGISCFLNDIDILASKSDEKEIIAECYYFCYHFYTSRINGNKTTKQTLIGKYSKKKPGVWSQEDTNTAYVKALKLNPYRYDLTSKFVNDQQELNKDFIQQISSLTDSKSLYQKAIMYLLQNNFQEALQIFSVNVDNEAKPAFLLGAVLTLTRLGDYKKAEELFLSYQEMGAKLSADYWYIAGELMIGLGQYKNALYCYNKTLETYSNYIEAILGIANLYLKVGKLAQAKQCYFEVLKRDIISKSLIEIAKQKIVIIETEEFIIKQIKIESETKNLAIEFDKSLEKILAFDLIYTRKWLQSNLPTSLAKTYLKILEKIDYGYKLLNSEGILPKTFGVISDLLPKEKQIISLIRAEKNLTADHNYFRLINNINKKLEQLKKDISILPELNDELKQNFLLKIEEIQNYYRDYKKQIPFMNRYLNDTSIIELSNIAEAKKPLFFSDMVKIYFDGKNRFLKSEVWGKLNNNNLQDNNDKFGKHIVINIDNVHYKLNPYAPGIEFAVNSLHNLILDGITPPNKLLKIYIDEGNEVSKKEFIYLASKTIEGKNLHEILTHPNQEIRNYLTKLDMENYSGTVIACLLTCPGDAKPDNFITIFGTNKETNRKLIKIVGIDNDISFCKGQLGINNVSGKQKVYSDILNILYFFPQMDDLISPKIREHLLNNNIVSERIISSWLKALYMQNERYKYLKGNGFTEKDLEDMKLPIKFKGGTVVEVYRKLDGIINILKANEYVTHNNLFKKFYPGVSYFYEKMREQTGGEFEAIKKLYMAAAEDEKLAQQLESRKALESREAWNQISTSRMMNKETFEKTYNRTIEREAEDFIAAIDFSKFGQEDDAVFKMLQENLYFIGELRVHNINKQQLEKLLLTIIDNELVSKFDQLRAINLIDCQIAEIDIKDLLKYFKIKTPIVKNIQEEQYRNDKLQFELQNIHKLIINNINKNIDINKQDSNGNTALHNAVLSCNINLAKSLLDQGINESIKNNLNKTAIELAQEKEQLADIYQLIAEHNPEVFWNTLLTVNTKIATQLAKTMSVTKLSVPIKTEIVNNNIEALEKVLSDTKFADVTLQLVSKLDLSKNYSINLDSILHLLSKNYNDTYVNILETIINKAPNLVVKVNKLGQTAADIAQDTKKLNFLSLLMNKKCVLKKFNNKNEEIVYKAAKYGIKVEKSDLENGYDYNKCDNDKNNLLKLTAKNKDFDLFQKIKSHFTEELMEIYDVYGNHKLACDNKTQEIIKIFKKYNFIINEEEAITGKINFKKVNEKKNNIVYELLTKVSNSDQEELQKAKDFEKLLEVGADINISNRLDKWTPIHLAVSSKQKYYLEKLLEKRGEILQLDSHGRNALDIAKRYNYKKIIKLLAMGKEIKKDFSINEQEMLVNNIELEYLSQCELLGIDG